MTENQKIVLQHLTLKTLLTEHELVIAISQETRKREIDIQPIIVTILTQMRKAGLIWAGELTNREGQKMMAACLTSHGREVYNNANNTKQTTAAD